MTQTDDTLVQRHLLGDETAFPELVNRYIRSVYNLAYRSTGDAMEAENIVQETFVKAYVALPRAEPGTPFKPWVLTIAVNLCRNWARRMRRDPLAARAAGPGEEEAPILDQVPDPGPGPLEALLAGEAGAALERAVAALPLPYRQAVILRYVEGLSYEELAQALDLPLNTVRTHLFRAKERLRQALLRWREREGDGLSRGAEASGSAGGGATGPGRGTKNPGAPRRLLRLPEESG